MHLPDGLATEFKLWKLECPDPYTFREFAIAGGYYDLATPYFEGIYEMHHLPIPKARQANINISYHCYASIIQVLLIPSYGMSIGTGMYCRQGGVVFNVDGRGNGTTDMRRKGPGMRAVSTFATGRGCVDIWNPVLLPV